MSNFFIHLGQSISILTFIVSLLFLKKYKATVLVSIVFLLFLTCFIDIIGYAANKKWITLPGYIHYNIYNWIYFTGVLFLFYKVLKVKRYKQIIIAGGIILQTVYLGSLFHKGLIANIGQIPYFTGAISIIVSCFLYFLEVLKGDRILYLKNNLFFFLSCGWLLFYIGYLPIRISRIYFGSNYEEFRIVFWTHLFLIIGMNLLFIFGLLWSKRKHLY